MHSAGLGQRQTRPLLVPRPGQGEDKGREEWLTLTEHVRLPRPSPVQAAPHLTPPCQGPSVIILDTPVESACLSVKSWLAVADFMGL